MPSVSILHRTARELGMAHVRLAHGTFVRAEIVTVAILAQGTNRGDALCAALLLRRAGSNPVADLFHLFAFGSSEQVIFHA